MKRLFLSIVISFAALSGAAGLAEAPAKTRATILSEMENVQQEGIGILRSGFSDRLEVQRLVEMYDQTAEADGKAICFNAAWLYVDLTLTPKLTDPDPAQKAALARFDVLKNRHLELETELANVTGSST